MKKLIVLLALLVSGISFSNTNTNVSKSKSLCKWIKNPNIYVSKEIDLINHSQLKGDIYCDVENDYMTYYVGIGNIEIGLLYNLREKKELTYENIFNILADFQSDILKLLPTNILTDYMFMMPRGEIPICCSNIFMIQQSLMEIGKFIITMKFFQKQVKICNGF